MGDIFEPILTHPTFILLKQLAGLFYFVFSVALIYWTYRDAAKRGAMGWFWGLVVFLFNLAGWIVYMVVRPPEFEEDRRERELEIRTREAELKRASEKCPACLRPVDEDFLICPYCMKTLKKACVECGKPMKMGWKVCPYCKGTQE